MSFRLKIAYGIMTTVGAAALVAFIVLAFMAPSILILPALFGVVGALMWAIATIDNEKYGWMEKGPGPR